MVNLSPRGNRDRQERGVKFRFYCALHIDKLNRQSHAVTQNDEKFGCTPWACQWQPTI